MILNEINQYLAKSGYELYYETPQGETAPVLMKRKGTKTGVCTALEEYMIDTLTSEPPDEMAKRVLGLIQAEFELERVRT